MSGIHKLSVVPSDARPGMVQAGCLCGWSALGLDGTSRSAGQVWSAHMYAAGFRTKAQIEKVAA